MPEANLLYLISQVRMQAFRYLEAELQKAGLADLPVSFGDVLFVVARTQPIEMQEIGLALRKDKSTMTNVVKELEKRGYVKRSRDPEDRRRVRVELTPRASGALPTFRRISRRFNRRLTRGFAPEEREVLRAALERMSVNM
ncbi:MAG: MarR family transcriptional regulator, partial [Leptospirales bacterium]